MKKQLLYGSYKYEYTHIREDRKTMSLTVKPDMTIVLKTPQKATQRKIDSFMKRKWLWLEKQLQYFKKYQRKKYKKEYVSGESFLYLGRQYTLKVKKTNKNKVSLYRGKLTIETKNKNRKYVKRQLDMWYNERAEIIFKKRFNEVFKNFKYDNKPELVTRKMKKRWGSFLSDKKIILNPRLIKAPKECIDYVITHELCHIKHKTHSKNYYIYLEKMYPGWEKVKEQLELRLA